jgi:hypothetical protein
MAKLSVKDDIDVFVGDLAPLVLDEKGNLSEQQISNLSSTVRDLVTKVNGGISHGTGNTGHRGNLDEAFTDVVTPSVADTEFAVPHTLGRLPQSVVIVRANKSATIYDSSAGSWTDTLIYLKCNVASAQLRLNLW